MQTLLRDRLFLAVVSGHFALDILNSLGPVLLAVLAAPFALSNAQIGVALTLYTLISSLTQPFFGLLADRMRKPALLGGMALAWTAMCYVAVAFAPTWPLLLTALLLGAIGSGCFHPIGTSQAALVGRTTAGRASSIFFFGGQMGLAIGPLLGGLLFARSANFGVLPLCLLAVLPVVLLLTTRPAEPLAAGARIGGSALKVGFWIVAAFVVLVALRSSIQAAYTAFLPKLFADRGWDAEAYGALAGMFLFTAAIGNIVTGEVADRLGMRAATFWPLLLGVPAGLLCLWAPSVAAAFVGCALAGFFIGGQHSVLVVHAQRLLPARQGFAAGLILGFTFATGGIGTWLGGLAGDVYGLLPAMQVLTLLGLPTALLALTLPGATLPVRLLTRAHTEAVSPEERSPARP